MSLSNHLSGVPRRHLCSTSHFSLSINRYRCTFSSNTRIIAENDIVILRKKSALDKISPKLTKPLKAGSTVQTHYGKILHDDLIGSGIRDVVKSSRSTELIVNFPTLEEYITLSSRVVTPIYPTDAAAIVTLLDLHVTPPTSDEFEPLEVLEAGTGHGSLTLHLARAMHAANTNPQYQGATLHTIEKEAKVSALAKHNVENFRRGVYSKGVEFYVGDVEEWLRKELEIRSKRNTTLDDHGVSTDTLSETNELDETSTLSSDPSSSSRIKPTPFLTAALLDLPSPIPVLPLLADALHPDAFLGYFAPSITQIVALYKAIRIQRLPFFVDKVVEFGSGMGGSLRQWDIRLAKIRSREKAQKQDTKVESTVSDNSESGSESESLKEEAVIDESLYGTVCRPMVGGRVQGGGFYVVVRRMGNVKVRHEKTPEVTGICDVQSIESQVETLSEDVSAEPISEAASDSESVADDISIEEQKQ